MNWQHPIVDIFKQFGVYEIAHTQSKGQVTVVQDDSIGKKIIRLLGAISANNSVSVPDQQGDMFILNFYQLKGDILQYIQICKLKIEIPQSNQVPLICMIIIKSINHNYQYLIQKMLQINGRFQYWIWNIFGEFWALANQFLQNIQGDSLTKIILNMCSMNIRGMDTGDNLESMPKQMLFKLAKGQKQNEEYQIAYCPNLDVQPQVSKQPLVEVTADIFFLDNLQKMSDNKEKFKQETQKSFKQQQITNNSQQIEELVKKKNELNVVQNKSVDAQDSPLQPYPIQQLDKIIGFTVKTCPDIKWGRQNETQKQIKHMQVVHN